ncbi:MAG: T9SS type A sorting domain-containing protein, partial [Nitrososphaeraceae archaeon]
VDDDCDGQIDEGCSSTCSNATGLTTTNITSKSATLNWSASVNPARWQVQYRKAISGATWTNIKPAGSARSVNISSLTANQRYNWHIRAKCGTTWTAYSATLSFTTLSALQSTIQLSASAKNMANENITMLQLYPNPSKGQFVIDLHMGEKISVNAKIELIDMMGQTVYRETGSLSNGKLQRTISMPSSLSRGFYMVKVIVNDNVYVTKLILAK